METKELILSKSTELFLNRGIRSVSMDEIATQLGISKKTLYEHFATKADLVTNCIVCEIDEDKQKIQEIHETAANAIDEMMSIYQYISNTHREINPASIYDLQRAYPKAWKVYTDYHEDFMVRMTKENLERGIAQGLYRKDLNVEIITKIYVSGIDNLLNEKKFPLLQYGLIPLYKEYLSYHLHAILSTKGLDYLQKLNYA